jgi:hypothetical protein
MAGSYGRATEENVFTWREGTFPDEAPLETRHDLNLTAQR